MKQNSLPSFRQRGLSLSSLNVPRRYHLPLILLRTLSLIPAIIGGIHNIQSALNVPIRDSGGAINLQSTQIDFWVANLWCALAGYWSWILQTSMMRRWLYHYEISNAIVRLVTLTVINWSVAAFLDSKIPADQPIRHWMIACFVLLVSNVIKLCFASSPKYHQKAEDVQSPRLNIKSTAVKVLVLPLFVVTLLTMFAGLYQMEKLQYTTSQLMQRNVRFDASLKPNEISKDASVSILVLILSSWTAQGPERRQMLRETSLKLMERGSKDVSITYRFVIGQPPSSRAQMSLGTKIEEESSQYHDIIMVPASDTPKHTSRKLLEALKWSENITYDYLCKTSDDVFVRWDVVKSDMKAQGKSSNFWRGMVFRNMPSDAPDTDKYLKYDYTLPVLPAYTTSTFYTLSKDVVDTITGVESPRRFVASEERNIALWLFGYDIQPSHDARIQDNGGCEEDLIAMRFNDKERPNMRKVYQDIIKGRSQCASLSTNKCSLCYPCHGKADDWRSNNLHCDVFKGVTLRDQPEYLKVSGAKVKDDLEPSVIGVNDEWIIDGVLSKRSSKFSETDSWQLLYWVCWTSDPSTFTDRHWKALELVWVHEPRAVIFMISNTLPQEFFKDFTKQGYEIYVVHFNKDNLLNWHWYFGPGTLDWLHDWDKWEKGNYFYWHLTDYIRCLLLYNYGGTYMDMDALWIRVPPDPNLEFIGSDYSGLVSDREWTLDEDGLYLPQGLMRFKRGWSLFREMCEYAFSSYSYDPGCFNCHGPKAITSYVRNHRAALEMAGFTILPREILYPAGYTEIHKFLLSNPLAEQELKTKIMVTSWNIHLFGKMTNNLPIQDGSLVGHVLKKFDLDIPHRDVKTKNIVSSTGSWDVPMKLVGPRNFIYRATSPFTTISPDSVDNRRRALQQPAAGKFQGLDVLYVRGGPAKVRQVKIAVEVAFGKLKIGVPLSTELSATTVELTDATKKDINILLNSLVYSPSPLLAANGGRDRLKVSVSYDSGEKDEILVDVIVVETEEDEIV